MTAKEPRLTTVTRTQGANRALKDGTIEPAGAELDFVEVPVLVHAFRRMVRQLEFDVCEMAVTTYLCARSFGVGFTALPIFLVRGLHHGAIQTHPAAGVSDPRHVVGRKVGVNRGYTVTTGVWARGILADEYGVAPEAVTWVLSGDEHVEQYRPPANVVAAPEGATLAELLAAGELAATIGAEIDDPDVRPLIPDPEGVAMTALTDRGLYPINHLIVVRDDVLADHPGLAVSLFEAFAEAKQRYVEDLRHADGSSLTGADRLNHTVMQVTGRDPLPYGLDPNRDILEKLLDYALAQKILPSRPALKDVFAEETWSLQA
ncbi:MAG: ABC transporter substrate-binding protein [Acidobacteriota bacterium]|nr:ABC transporter substrate-binding protein [Acidobacteriota bacterium]